jgi:hypothetical protein
MPYAPTQTAWILEQPPHSGQSEAESRNFEGIRIPASVGMTL